MTDLVADALRWEVAFSRENKRYPSAKDREQYFVQRAIDLMGRLLQEDEYRRNPHLKLPPV